MDITKAVISGSLTALKAVMDTLTLPKLICTSPVWTISFDAEHVRQHFDAKVSESVVISEMGIKAFISDNVAPGPSTWRIEGYIGGGLIPEPTSFYTPVTQRNIQRLRDAFRAGTVMSFQDIDNELYPYVVIQSLDIEHKCESRNKRPFGMVLKEINILSSLAAGVVSDAAKVASGTINGEAVSLGTTNTVAQIERGIL